MDDTAAASRKRKRPEKWTEAADRELTKLVEKHGEGNWKVIAETLDDHDGNACSKRWRDSLAPGIKKGAWSEEEDAIIVEAHARLGGKWTEIAELLPGRTGTAICKRWMRNLDPALPPKGPPKRKDKWTEAADRELTKLVEKHGEGNWKVIAETLDDRDETACR